MTETTRRKLLDGGDAGYEYWMEKPQKVIIYIGKKCMMIRGRTDGELPNKI